MGLKLCFLCSSVFTFLKDHATRVLIRKIDLIAIQKSFSYKQDGQMGLLPFNDFVL